MIISRTPFRISFFGGGTDYPVWYRENGGAVLATTIDKYCHMSCRYLPPFFEFKSRILYSKIENVRSNDEIEHPAVREILRYMNVIAGVEIHHDGDLPSRTGLGSSSAFTVGMLHCLFALTRTMPTKMQLAKEAIHIEQVVLKETVGCQDQVTAAVGGLNRIDFMPNEEIRITPIIIPQERLQEFQDHLLLYFTGFTRTSAEIAQEQLRRIRENRARLIRMYEMVDEGISILAGKADLSGFGALLHESWNLKRSLSSKVSTQAVDEVYEEARRAGTIGGKLLGAGGGGFMLLFARKEHQPRIRERLKGLLRVPFRFETNGSQIIFYEPDAALETPSREVVSVR